MINIGMTKYNLSNESTAFYIKIMKAHSAEEHESAIMKCLSQNSYKFAKAAKYHLPNLQLFQIQPYHPTSHFQSLSFLPLSSHHKSQNFEHQRERERERAQQRRWGERLNLAFREWSGRCLEIFHILFTAGRFQPGTAESWRVPLPGHSSSLSLFYLFPASFA